ncbi:DUF1330 domain-containing protein [Methylobacterium planeticum]|uniref:DUF1330 domain-containing protein n=1 Tax=Methylobacterium planeticum TaxID=2615211 RepID=A0A6N6MZU0_9HYPH|nr:DUF1330 domain-containing protein [Methylobacterium planeticum]KAB1075235.1 DUF1330 domain-containing protein [Methylobacterium planeticum]
MARGYWIVRVDVRDTEAYTVYAAANGEAFRAFGGRFLVRGGAFEAVSGTARARNVVIEFPTYADALACWHSDAYQAARAKQKGGAETDLIVIEGYDGPQPSEGAPPQPANPASE